MKITAGTEAVDALARMYRAGQSRLLVMDGEQLVGILTLKDLLRFLAFKIELEERA
jgi:CBS domain-containing protein